MVVLIALLLSAITLLICWLKHLNQYWRRRDIPHNKPRLLVGNIGRKHLSEFITDTYNQFKDTGPFAGFYLTTSKAMILLDLDLIKNILIKDFNNFDQRGTYHNLRDDPLTENLAYTDGDKWRRLRRKTSPTFSSGKIKNMFPKVVQIAQELKTVIEERIGTAPGGSVLELTDLTGSFTSDVIGSCAFGIDCNSLRYPNAEFVVMGKRFFTQPQHNKIVEGLIHNFPDLARLMRMRIINQSVSDFYMRIVKETIAYREKTTVKRNDFMDMLIELKNNQDIRDENGNVIDALTEMEVAAQAFVFFVAGFETTSTTMALVLYELAKNPEVQSKVRLHLNEVMAKHKDQLTYECIKDMHYLDQCINETLRFYPVLPFLARKARARYVTSDPKYYIEAGSMVLIPSVGIHMDPDIYPDPEKFKPERFEPDEVQKRHACAWLPFGEGPRSCIGMRFAQMELCIGLSFLLRTFRFSVAPETQVPFKLYSNTFMLMPEDGIRLRVEKI